MTHITNEKHGEHYVGCHTGKKWCVELTQFYFVKLRNHLWIQVLCFLLTILYLVKMCLSGIQQPFSSVSMWVDGGVLTDI